MAVGAIVAGGAMVVGGTAAAIRANRLKGLAPNRQILGGSQEGQDASLANFAEKADQGSAVGYQGVNAMAQTGQQGGLQWSQGFGNMQGKQFQATNRANQAMALTNDFDPNAVVGAQSRAGMDSTTARAVGMAGGQANSALAARNAIASSSAANAQTAQAANVAALQGAQQKVVMQVDQRNQQAALEQAQAAQWQDTMNQGLHAQQSAAGFIGQYGQNQEQFNQAQIADTNALQLQANTDYDTRRQAERQRKSQNLWNLGSSLITGGGKVMGGAGGGG